MEKNTLFHPTPTTLQRLAEEKDIPIALIDQTNDENDTSFTALDAMPAALLDEVYISGRYAIGSRDLWYFGHDTTNDHFPAVVVGGKAFFDLVSPYAANARKQGRDITENLDLLTSSLTKAIDSLSENADATRKAFESAEERIASIAGNEGYINGELTGLFVAKLTALSESGVISSKAAATLSEVLINKD